MPKNEPTGVALCDHDDVADGAARGLRIERAAGVVRIFLVRQGSRMWGYENRCPHRGTPLDWVPDQFLDRDGGEILCATHGARFRIEDGRCTAGPCPGESLRSLALERRGDTWFWLADCDTPSTAS